MRASEVAFGRVVYRVGGPWIRQFCKCVYACGCALLWPCMFVWLSTPCAGDRPSLGWLFVSAGYCLCVFVRVRLFHHVRQVAPSCTCLNCVMEYVCFRVCMCCVYICVRGVNTLCVCVLRVNNIQICVLRVNTKCVLKVKWTFPTTTTTTTGRNILLGGSCQALATSVTPHTRLYLDDLKTCNAHVLLWKHTTGDC